MEKTEKIISEFERFVQEYERDFGFSSYDCEMLKSVLALLKAQEPRVMAGAELIEGIRKAPIILKPNMDTAPVVHGRWIKMTGMMPPEYHGHYECSECQWHMKGLRNSWTREEELSYCPNCGAKMDKEGE